MERFESAAARRIVSPEDVRATGDPVALALRAKYQQIVMPSLDLAADDAVVLIDYIGRQSGVVRNAAATGAPAPSGAVTIAAAPAAAT